jgi:hypothetical protein
MSVKTTATTMVPTTARTVSTTDLMSSSLVTPSSFPGRTSVSFMTELAPKTMTTTRETWQIPTTEGFPASVSETLVAHSIPLTTTSSGFSNDHGISVHGTQGVTTVPSLASLELCMSVLFPILLAIISC